MFSYIVFITNEPSHDKTNKMSERTAKTDQTGHPSAQSDQRLRSALNG